MASDDDDESLAQFLESEVLSEISDRDEEKREEQLEDEDDNRVANGMLLMEDDSSDEVEEESDAQRKLNEEDDISEEVEMRKEEEENDEEDEKQVNKMLIEDAGISCEDEDKEEREERDVKRRRIEKVDISNEAKSIPLSSYPLLSSAEFGAASSSSKNNEANRDEKNNRSSSESRLVPGRTETGSFSEVPPELFRHILKFLSSEDLIACSLVCRLLNLAASDESLWRRLYFMRWGLLPPNKLRECAWKKLYIQRDEEDMMELVSNCPSEFKEYYIQMQAAKRSQAPHPSQVLDDQIIIDKTVSDQVSTWKSSRGLTEVVEDHACSGDTCAYYQIGDVFICEKTGTVHVCDDTCKEVVADPANELLVCTISGRCFDRLLSPAEMEPDVEQQQGGVADEAEPFMGSGRFARAYLLGYNCVDEKELEATWRFC